MVVWKSLAELRQAQGPPCPYQLTPTDGDPRMLRESIFQASVAYFLQPIQDLLADETVTEIMINRFDEIYVERFGRLFKTENKFISEDALLSAVHNVAQWVGREITAETPVLDARLPDGSRVNVILPPGARRGLCMTIRKFKPGGLSMDDLLEFGSISESAVEFISLCVQLHKNIIVSGGTGTGKTSLLGAVTEFIPEVERVVVIEDTSELKLRQPHSIYLEVQKEDEFGRGGLTIRQLFVTSLRMRPDRIIVGEVRGGEALDMIQSMLSGHSGALSTVHANSPRDAMIRLETLSLMSDVEIPVYVARAQVASAIDLVVQLSRFSADGSRRVTRISEIEPLDKENQYRFRDLYQLQMEGKSDEEQLVGELEPTGNLPTFWDEARQHGLMKQAKLSKSLWTQSSDS